MIAMAYDAIIADDAYRRSRSSQKCHAIGLALSGADDGPTLAEIPTQSLAIALKFYRKIKERQAGAVKI